MLFGFRADGLRRNRIIAWIHPSYQPYNVTMAWVAPPIWAVHISDGVIHPSWLIGGGVVAVLFVALGLWRIADKEISRVALLTAGFFVASAIHIPVFVVPVRYHLLLNGLVGVMLGRRAAVAICIGLLLQFCFLSHGGIYVLGVNTCVMAIPALAAATVFRYASRRLPLSLAGFVVGFAAVMLTALLNAMVLILGGEEDWRAIASLLFLAHVPIALVEGWIVAVVVAYLARVQPALLPGYEPRPVSEVGKTSSNDTSH
jgi:cobalt/nickel transport system permease protein